MVRETSRPDKTDAKPENKVKAIAAYSGAHPAHQKMLDSCCAASMKMLGEWSVDIGASGYKKSLAYLSTALRLRISDYEVIVIEGTTPAVIMAPLINTLKSKHKTIIALSADDALFRAFIANNRVMRLITRFGFRYISAIVAIGDLTARLANTHLTHAAIETRYPPVLEERLDPLTTLQPSIDSHNILLIGGRSEHYKGVDIAVKCLRLLRNSFPDAGLTILGFRDLSEKLAGEPGVNSPGPVDDIVPYLSSSSVLIHPARGDSAPLAVIESMLGGVVPFVSEWTGNSSIVQQVDPDFVVPLSAEEFASRIAGFWNSPAAYRQTISAKCRQVALKYVDQATNQPSLEEFIENAAKKKTP